MYDHMQFYYESDPVKFHHIEDWLKKTGQGSSRFWMPDINVMVTPQDFSSSPWHAQQAGDVEVTLFVAIKNQNYSGPDFLKVPMWEFNKKVVMQPPRPGFYVLDGELFYFKVAPPIENWAYGFYHDQMSLLKITPTGLSSGVNPNNWCLKLYNEQWDCVNTEGTVLKNLGKAPITITPDLACTKRGVIKFKNYTIGKLTSNKEFVGLRKLDYFNRYVKRRLPNVEQVLL